MCAVQTVRSALVGHLSRCWPLSRGGLAAAGDRAAAEGAGTAEGVPPGALAPLGALAAPDERGRLRVPALDRRGEPAHQLLGALGVLAAQRPRDDDPLQRLG